MKVLIACEFSATVRDAFAACGHEAWSCDMLPSEKKGLHLQMDVFKAINYQRWDFIGMHPPCTAIALSGNSTYGKGMIKHHARIESIEWTARLWTFATAKCSRVYLENPKNVMGPYIGKMTQEIQPFQFGHPERKVTWLWLHGLPPLKPTNDVFDEMMKLPRKQRERLHYMSPGKNRGHERSRTFSGIAEAMTKQWNFLVQQTNERQTQ